MTGLLVSVRDVVEARAALAGGADLIDVKEPSRGSLGAADSSVWQQIADEVNGRVPLSAALGELILDDVRPPVLGSDCLHFAKLGLAAATSSVGWKTRWAAVIRQLPPSVKPVAVAYADWKSCGAPEPSDVLQCAAELDCEALLLDTFDKSQGNLFDWLSVAEVSELVQAAGDAGMKTVLAGSLDRGSIPLAQTIQPDFIAVRGCVCPGHRQCRVDQKLVAELTSMLQPVG